MATQEIDNETLGKLRMLGRLLISYQDFHQARRIANIIIQEEFENRQKTERGEMRFKSKLIWEGLNCAMIIAYSRPFSDNKPCPQVATPRLPRGYLKLLTDEEREIHEESIRDRNTVLAHSDSTAWSLQLFFFEIDGKKLSPRIPVTPVRRC